MRDKTSPPSKLFTEDDIRKLIFHQLDHPPDLIELQRTIIKWAVDLLQANAGEIFLWDPAREALVLTLPTGFSEAYTQKYEGVELKSGEGLAGLVFKNQQPMIIDDYYDWEGRSPVFHDGEQFQLNNILAVPMIWQKSPIGVLTINTTPKQKSLSEDDLRLAQLFANIAAVSIMNARLYEMLQIQTRSIQNALLREVEARTEALQKHMMQLNLSAQVSREITSILNIDQLLSQVVNLVNEAFGYYSVQVYLADSPRQVLVLRAASGPLGKSLLSAGRQLKLDANSLNGQAATHRQLIVINDTASSDLFQVEELLPNTASELVVPLQAGVELLGTLDVQSDQRDAFSQLEILMLQSLGDQVAIAIQNARLYEQSKDMAVLEERNRLARELHDSVTQSLFSMDLHAKAVATYIRKDIDKAQQQITELRQTAHDTLQEMRSLIFDLRPISLKDIGLQHAMSEQIARLQSESEADISLEIKCAHRLPDEIEQGLFRIAQEGLRNAVKHAAAEHINCILSCDEKQVSLTVQDDGRGFNPQSPLHQKQTFGLIGMQERIDILKGFFEVKSKPGCGTTLLISIPL